MSRISPVRYALIGVFLVVFATAALMARGGLYIVTYEADTAHLLEIVMRMAEGQSIHRDFHTPIGALSFWPVVIFVKAGLGVGLSYHLAQGLLGLAVMPAVVRAGTSRMTGLGAWVFLASVVILSVSQVYGSSDDPNSASMYYNRWAWVVAFPAVALAFLPVRFGTDRPKLDGAMIGLALAYLALAKVTFLIGLAVPVVFALVLRRAFGTLLWAVVTGAVVALVALALGGLGYYQAYLSDLSQVAASATRAAPSGTLAQVISNGYALMGTLVLVLSILVLRQGGNAALGTALLIFAPAFLYITYQNFGNDPKWLMILVVILLAVRPARGMRVIFNAEARNAVAALALVAFAIIGPSFFNMAISVLRGVSVKPAAYSVLFPRFETARDLYVATMRSNTVVTKSAAQLVMPAMATTNVLEGSLAPIAFRGEAHAMCEAWSGYAGTINYMADRLRDDMGLGPDNTILVADSYSAVWLAAGLKPLMGASPWYYAGTPGLENADYLLVPTCPFSFVYTRAMLAAVDAAGADLGTPLRDDAFLLYPVIAASAK